MERFLSALAVEGQVAAGTQNQALAALLFLYKVVLGVELPWLDSVQRAKRPRRLPTVPAREEARWLLAAMEGRPWLIASLLYGTGLRLMECLRLRVKDVDFARVEIAVRGGKGGKDRRTVLPRSLVEPLQRESSRRDCCTKAIWPPVSARCGCRTRWRASIRTPRANSAGSTCSRRCGARAIRATAWSGGIISTMGAVAGAENRVSSRRHRQAGVGAHVAAFVRHASAGGGLRHPHRTGIVGAQGREYDADLHACARSRRRRSEEPAGPVRGMPPTAPAPA